jgi:hypothetical protein
MVHRTHFLNLLSDSIQALRVQLIRTKNDCSEPCQFGLSGDLLDYLLTQSVQATRVPRRF